MYRRIQYTLFPDSWGHRVGNDWATDLIWSDFQIYYMATVIKTAWYRWENKYIDQRVIRIENPEKNPHKHDQQTCRSNSREEDRFFNSVRPTDIDRWNHLNSNLISFTKINSNWVTDLNVKHKTFRKKKRQSSQSMARQRILRFDTKSMIHQRKIDKPHQN